MHAWPCHSHMLQTSLHSQHHNNFTTKMNNAISCSGYAKYTLTFQAEWTKETHPEDFPSRHNPHFSSLVGCSHNTGYLMWKPGTNATQAVKDVAEHGTSYALNNEINRAIKEKKALHRFEGRGISNTGTLIVKNIEVNTTYPLVSAITMIGPSPDWFVGVHDYNLCNETNGTWFGKKVKDLFLYDSGTDNATTFVHRNEPSNPVVPIFLITHLTEGSLKSNNTIKRFGTFTFEIKSNSANVFVYSYVNTALLNMIIHGVFVAYFY